jgi:ribosomal protein S18 acetylase RimI-like enzyme
MDTATLPKITIRPLTREDLDTAVAIDAAIEGRSRRDYFERRLAAALREPARHAQFAATDARGVAGYILARVMTGEFGRPHPGLRLEIVGVRADVKGKGVGAALLQALNDYARRHSYAEMRTTAAWNDRAMLRWLSAMGFTLASAQVVDCAVDGGAYRPERDDAISLPEGFGPGHEINYGTSEGNDFEKLARDTADVRSMTAADLREIVRIDRLNIGRDREAYIKGNLAEAMDDSAIRVSLTARLDGTIVGFLMARADFGDFGRTEPVAIIDTLGVDPEYAHRGVGHALVSQLFANLGALRVERVETVVAHDNLPLLGFFYDAGFSPSRRLTFVRSVV